MTTHNSAKYRRARSFLIGLRGAAHLALLAIPLLAIAPASRADESAKNAILFIGDGMGFSQVSAGRIYKGGAAGGKLALDAFPQTAFVRTWCANRMVTDSAAAGTAMACAIKTNAGFLGITPDGKPVDSILKLAKAQGKSIGLVTTTTVTHATPAAFYANISDRGSEAEIADQLLAYGQIDLVIGGGREFFTPETENDEETGAPGKRKDGRNLMHEAETKGYRLVRRQSEHDALLADLDAGKAPEKLLALFSPGMMSYEFERSKDVWGEPSLRQMTELAIRMLSRNPKGYFLMVEGGRIDHACHSNQALLAATDMVAFDDAVAAGAESLAKHPDTFILVTADHETGGMAINGYPPIEVKEKGLFTTAPYPNLRDIVTFASGPGADRKAMEGVNRDEPRYRQPSLNQMGSAAHTAVDVGAWSMGPGSSAVHGSIDNTDIAKILRRALRL